MVLPSQPQLPDRTSMSKCPVPSSPAGWYDDPYEAGVLRYFDGRQWTDRAEPDAGQTPAVDRWPAMEMPDADLPTAPSAPRPRWLRLVYATAGVLAVVAAVNLAVRLWPVGGLLLALLFQPAVVAVVAPLVSYRRVDAFSMLVPFYNLYLMCRFAWRLAYLPYRDWAPRSDEATGWQRLRHPERPDEPLYLMARPRL